MLGATKQAMNSQDVQSVPGAGLLGPACWWYIPGHVLLDSSSGQHSFGFAFLVLFYFFLFLKTLTSQSRFLSILDKSLEPQFPYL